MEEPAEPKRGRGAALTEALREDLEAYAVSDLEERIAALEGEIARSRAQIEKKKSSRAAADAFFKQG
ncbi:MAG: DUF1192 domain-containing protein [Caulobacteraceae bacterium]